MELGNLALSFVRTVLCPVVSIAISSFVLVASAHAQPNTFNGSCAALASFVDLVGVTDDKGVPHVGKSGWTNATFDASVALSGIKHSGGNKAGLDCYVATAKPKFTVVTHSTTLTYKPTTACDQCSCDKEAANYNAQVAQHEMLHVQEAQQLVAKANANSKPIRVSACRHLGDSTSVKSLLTLNAFAQIKASSGTALVAAYDKSQDEFDASTQGKVKVWCPSCHPCGSNETPHCDCPAGEGDYQGSCLKAVALSCRQRRLRLAASIQWAHLSPAAPSGQAAPACVRRCLRGSAHRTERLEHERVSISPSLGERPATSVPT